MRNLLFRCSFAGTNYFGFQKQKRFISIEETLEKAFLEQTGEQVTVIGCGRTDARVHAMNFYFNVMTESQIPLDRFPLALNCVLPDDIAVHECREVPMDFHARYHTKGKTYRYQIWNDRTRNALLADRVYFYPGEVDIGKMRRAGRDLCGTHDFSAFMAAGAQVKSPVRTIYDLTVEQDGPMIVIEVTGNGFLYNMVRIIAGTLLKIGRGSFPEDCIPEILEGRDRRRAGSTAPPQGLFLKEVYYEIEKTGMGGEFL